MLTFDLRQTASMNEGTIKHEDFVPTKQSAWKPWVAASIAALSILAISVGLMAALGLFTPPKDDTGAKSLAAAVSLVGAVLSAVVALVGTIIKYSMDDRNARQAELEATRNYALATQAEQRNRIEAAIRAVDLLSENNEDATRSQMGGALLALVSLGELDLALSLLAQLWPDGKATASVAEVILIAALKSKSTQTQMAAGVVLFQNAANIQQAGYNIWPLQDLIWRSDLHVNCRLGLVLSAAEWLKSIAKQDPPFLQDPALVLYGALEDPHPGVAGIAAACLLLVVERLPGSYWADNGLGLRITVDQISERLAKAREPYFSSYAAKYDWELRNVYSLLTPKPRSKNPSE